MTNPYASPTADVIENSAGSIKVLPRFSTWGVFFLSLFTLGIYSLYWLYTRVGNINSVVENKIPVILIHGYLFLTIGSWILQFSGATIGDPAIMAMVSSLISLVSGVLYIVVIYKMRNRMCDEMLQTPRWGGIMTFFFSILYLNYKINEAIDNSES